MKAVACHSGPVASRLQTIQKLIHDLQAAKQQQATLPGYQGAKHGVWICMQLWKCVQKQLQMQMHELAEWEKLLLATHEELMDTQAANVDLNNTLQAMQAQADAQMGSLERHVADLEAQLSDAQRQWSNKKQELGAQVDNLLADLHARDDLVRDNDTLTERLKQASRQAEALNAAADDARAHAAELQQRLDYLERQRLEAATDRDSLIKQVRELGVQLADARDQLHSQKQAMAVRRPPSQHLMEETTRLRDDNRRLVALLGETSEWRQLAKRMQDEEGALRYVPIHEVLLHKGGLSDTYPPLDDRPLKLNRSAHVPEEWHWVPQEAIDAVLEAVARVMPGAPMEPLLGLLLSLNKIWRRREAKALAKQRTAAEEEMRELHRLYRQRAPYEAVVGKTQLCHLKRQLRMQAAHAQHLVDKAKGEHDVDKDDNKVLLQLGLESINTMSKRVNTLKKKSVKLRKRLAAKEAEPAVCDTCLDNLLLQSSPSMAPPFSVQQPVNLAGMTPAASPRSINASAGLAGLMPAGPSYMQRPASPTPSTFISTASQRPSSPGLSATTYQLRSPSAAQPAPTYQLLQAPARPASNHQGSPTVTHMGLQNNMGTTQATPQLSVHIKSQRSVIPRASKGGSAQERAGFDGGSRSSRQISAVWPEGIDRAGPKSSSPLISPRSTASYDDQHGKGAVVVGPGAKHSRVSGARRSAGRLHHQPGLMYSIWDSSGALKQQGTVRGLP